MGAECYFGVLAGYPLLMYTRHQLAHPVWNRTTKLNIVNVPGIRGAFYFSSSSLPLQELQKQLAIDNSENGVFHYDTGREQDIPALTEMTFLVGILFSLTKCQHITHVRPPIQL